MAASTHGNSTKAQSQVRAYMRRLLGSSGRTGGGAGSSKITLPKSYSTSSISPTPHSLPRQLEAMVSTVTSTKKAGGKSTAGGAWIVSPVASTIKSLFSLFGGEGTETQTTRYRTKSRTPFQIVESVSPESGAGVSGLNESAAGLTKALAGNATATGGNINATERGGASLLMNNRLALVTALRRGLSESQGIGDVLREFEDGL